MAISIKCRFKITFSSYKEIISNQIPLINFCLNNHYTRLLRDFQNESFRKKRFYRNFFVSYCLLRHVRPGNKVQRFATRFTCAPTIGTFADPRRCAHLHMCRCIHPRSEVPLRSSPETTNSSRCWCQTSTEKSQRIVRRKRESRVSRPLPYSASIKKDYLRHGNWQIYVIRARELCIDLVKYVVPDFR